MRKRLVSFISLVALCVAVLCPLYAYAATPLDPSAEASLTLQYQKDGHAFSDLEINIYRVAEAFPDGTFQLIDPYASYPVKIYDITAQEQWKHVAVTLSSYIVADGIDPYRTATTDASGTVCFDTLETGLYLVSDAMGENNSGTYLFDRFMVYLPTPQADGSYDYTVEANPKCTNYVPKQQYRVTKLWQDEGHQEDRPREIVVDIYKDGTLHESQTLHAGNDWTYTWYVSEDDHSTWTVAERSVPTHYTVSIVQNEASFSILNTHVSNLEIPDPPPTGDTTNLLPYVLLLCISGIVLILVSVYGRKRQAV